MNNQQNINQNPQHSDQGPHSDYINPSLKKKITLKLIIIISVFFLVVIGVYTGLKFFKNEQPKNPEIVSKNVIKSNKLYSLVGAYIKQGNIWIKNFTTQQEVQITNIEDILFYKNKNWMEKKITDPEAQKHPANIMGIIRGEIIWSKDGSKIVYGKDAQKMIEAYKNNNITDNLLRSDMFVLNLQNDKELRIASSVNMAHHNRHTIAFSPDKTKIAWYYDITEIADQYNSSRAQTAPEIIITDWQNTLQQTKVFTGQKGRGSISYINWLPDGKTLLALYDKNSGYGGTGGVAKDSYSILTIDTITNKYESLISADRENSISRQTTTLSPDGTQIAYSIRRKINQDFQYDLYIYSIPQKSSKLIYSLPVKISGQVAYETKWSPDNKFIVLYLTDFMGKGELLLIISYEGKEMYRITGSDLLIEGIVPARITSFIWSPDSSKIVVGVSSGTVGFKKINIWIVDINGKSKTLLTNVEEGEGLPNIWIKSDLIESIIEQYLAKI